MFLFPSGLWWTILWPFGVDSPHAFRPTLQAPFGEGCAHGGAATEGWARPLGGAPLGGGVALVGSPFARFPVLSERFLPLGGGATEGWALDPRRVPPLEGVSRGGLGRVAV